MQTRKMRKRLIGVLLTGVMLVVTACGTSRHTQITAENKTEDERQDTQMEENAGIQTDTDGEKHNLSGVVPDELEYIPDGYDTPASEQGTLVKLTYDTWESFTYEEHTEAYEGCVGVSSIWVFGQGKIQCLLSEPRWLEQ